MIQQVVLLFIFTFLKSNTAIPTTTNLEKRTVAGPLVPYGNNEYGFSLSQTWNKAPDRSYISLSFDAFNQANSGQNNGVVLYGSTNSICSSTFICSEYTPQSAVDSIVETKQVSKTVVCASTNGCQARSDAISFTWSRIDFDPSVAFKQINFNTNYGGSTQWAETVSYAAGAHVCPITKVNDPVCVLFKSTYVTSSLGCVLRGHYDDPQTRSNSDHITSTWYCNPKPNGRAQAPITGAGEFICAYGNQCTPV